MSHINNTDTGSALPAGVSIEDLKAEIALLKKENHDLKSNRAFGLVWEHKDDANIQRTLSSIPVFVEDTGCSVIRNSAIDASENVLINGDNYHTLLGLQATHKARVDVIYIDPPYNTGNKDFIYNDTYVDKDDQWRHSSWLSFMEPRLQLAKNLLSDVGVIFVSIGDDEQAHLKLLLDRIFGEKNFVDTIIWSKNSGGKGDSKFIKKISEYIHVYKKSDAITEFKGKANDAAAYKLSDDKGAYRLEKLDRSSLHYSPTLDYPITAPDGTLIYPGSDEEKYNLRKTNANLKDWTWRWSQKKIDAEPDMVVFKKNTRTGLWGVYTKVYLEGKSDIKYSSILECPSNGGTKDIKAIFGGYAFTNPKPRNLVKALIALHPKTDAVVLDFFAGSGTTGHAVLDLNSEDGGTRTFILGTDNGKWDDTDGGTKIADEVTLERLRRVITGENWAEPGVRPSYNVNLRYFRVKMVDLGDESGSVLSNPDFVSAAVNTGRFAHDAYTLTATGDGWSVYESQDVFLANLTSLSDFEGWLSVVESSDTSKELVLYVEESLLGTIGAQLKDAELKYEILGESLYDTWEIHQPENEILPGLSVAGSATEEIVVF